jgi:hypothetical protein
MIEAHQEIVDKARAHIVSKDLMSLPWPETCTVVRRVPTAGNNPYYGSFSGATSRPPAADGALQGEWQINPFDPSWDAEAARLPDRTRLGRDLRHRAARNLRRAPRADPVSDAQPAAAAAATEHLDVLGGLGTLQRAIVSRDRVLSSEKLHVRQLQLRLWRNARVIYDVGMQTGRMTRDEAIALMTDPRRLPAMGRGSRGRLGVGTARLLHRLLHGDVRDPENAR